MTEKKDNTIRNLRIIQILTFLLLLIPFILWYISISVVSKVFDELTVEEINDLLNYMYLSAFESFISMCLLAIVLFLSFDKFIKKHDEILSEGGWLNYGIGLKTASSIFLLIGLYFTFRIIYKSINYVIFPSRFDVIYIILFPMLAGLLFLMKYIFDKQSIKNKDVQGRVIKNLDISTTIKLIENHLNKKNITFKKLGRLEEKWDLAEEVFELDDGTLIKVNIPNKGKQSKWMWPEKLNFSVLIKGISKKYERFLDNLKLEINSADS